MTFPFTQADVDRFLTFVEVLPNGCHFWGGARSRGDHSKRWYGSFWVSRHVAEDGTVTPGHMVRTHIFAAVALGAGHVRGHTQDHTCVFSLCVNPEHLECVTDQVNRERAVERRRQRRV